MGTSETIGNLFIATIQGKPRQNSSLGVIPGTASPFSVSGLCPHREAEDFDFLTTTLEAPGV